MTEAEYQKTCFKCGEIKPLSAFYKHHKMADGHVNKCKECNKVDVRLNRRDKLEYYKEYDAARDKDLTSERYKKKLMMRPFVRAKSKDKHLARQRVSNGIRDGLITKPNCCEHCGDTTRRLEAHHSSYAEDMQLSVTWLCTKCHGEVHRKYD